MTERIERTSLPGVGVRFTFAVHGDRQMSVLHHHSGRREVFLNDPEDPDAAVRVLDLNEDEGRTLAELLGGSQVVEEIGRLQQVVRGMAIDWLPIHPGSPAAGQTIGELQIRSSTGVTVLAVVRDEEALAPPGPDLTLTEDDILVVFGGPEDIRRVDELLRGP